VYSVTGGKPAKLDMQTVKNFSTFTDRVSKETTVSSLAGTLMLWVICPSFTTSKKRMPMTTLINNKKLDQSK
jgi:hypothetical protein